MGKADGMSTTTLSDFLDPNGYLSHYGLQAAPFRTSADPRLLWLGKTRRGVLEKLTAAIRRGGGIVVLTGDIGTGKTSLANGVSDTLRGEGLVTGKVLNSGFETSEFFQAVAHAYAIKGSFRTRDAFVARFHQLLGKPGANQKQALLIIDEAQSLSHDLLREIRDLSATEAAQGVSLSILLVGQKGLDARLAEDDNAALRQLIITRCRLDPLTPDEVGEYIRYCLKVAGSLNETFDSEAVREIATLSRGGPGVINTICNLALVIGHGRSARTIERAIIEECRKRMGRPGHSVARETRPAARPRPIARRAVEGSVRHRRGRRGAGRAAPVYASLLTALIVIAVGYALYTGWFAVRHDSARAAPLDTVGGPRDPENARTGGTPGGRDCRRDGRQDRIAASSPGISATPPLTNGGSDASQPAAKPAPVADQESGRGHSSARQRGSVETTVLRRPGHERAAGRAGGAPPGDPGVRETDGNTGSGGSHRLAPEGVQRAEAVSARGLAPPFNLRRAGPGYWVDLLRHTSLLARPRRPSHREHAGQSGLPRASSGSQRAPGPRPNCRPAALDTHGPLEY
jgi:type II secretory pathway predicted ATPase ExeA